jgi:hypothetical protein
MEKEKKEEEYQNLNKLQGKFGNMINNLYQNDTSLEFTTAGLKLNDAQVRILV